jgi:ABC-type polysaccharide/polyol phosphate export permease
VLAAKIILLNPISQAIQDIRYNFITKETITAWNYIANPLVMIPIILTIFFLIIGALVFRKKSKFFAEEV